MGKQYDAFISYSHDSDSELAEKLEGGLRRLGKKSRELRALEVFRDEASLSANPHLWKSLTEHLEQSRYFVLLLSPAAAGSEWVGREITEFLSTHPPENLLLALTEGELAWDDTTNEWAASSTALPPALGEAADGEPLWVDLRWAKDSEDLDLRHSRFRAAVAALAAPMHGVSKDDLEHQDIRAHRRAQRVRRMAVTAGVFALVGLAAMGFVLFGVASQRTAALEREQQTQQTADRAIDQAADAEESRTRAEEDRDLAEGETADAQAQAETATAREETARTDLAEIEDKLEAARTDLAEIQDKRDAARTDLAETEGKLTVAEDKLAETEIELGKTEVKLGKTEVKLGETEVKLGETEVKLGETEVKLGKTEVKLGKTEVKLGETEVKLGETEVKLKWTEEQLVKIEAQLFQTLEDYKKARSLSWFRTFCGRD